MLLAPEMLARDFPYYDHTRTGEFSSVGNGDSLWLAELEETPINLSPVTDYPPSLVRVPAAHQTCRKRTKTVPNNDEYTGISGN